MNDGLVIDGFVGHVSTSYKSEEVQCEMPLMLAALRLMMVVCVAVGHGECQC